MKNSNKNMKVKVCGMRDKENIEALLRLKPDYLGFIFYPKSSRYVGDDFSFEADFSIAENTQKIGVFVNEDLEVVKRWVTKLPLDGVQLHGSESPEYCQALHPFVNVLFKVFGVDEKFEFTSLKPYEGLVDYFLFDTKSPKHGGTGMRFDWSILNKYTSETPLILSGGIGADHIEEILALENLNVHAIDLNSKFEIAPALKDVDLLKNSVFDVIRKQ